MAMTGSPPGDYTVTFYHYSADDAVYENDGSGWPEDDAVDSTGGSGTVALTPGTVVEGRMDGIGGDPRYRITADGPGLLLVSLQSGGRSMSGWDDLLAVEMFDEDQDWSVEDGVGRAADGRIWQAGYLSAGRALLTVLPGSTFSWDGQVHDYTLEVRFVPGATAILDEPLRCGEKPSALPVGDTALATFEPDMTVRCFAVETPVAGRLLAHAAESTANGYGSDLQIRIATDRDGLRLDFGREVTAVLEPGTYLLAFDRGYGGARAQFHVGTDLVEGAAPPTAETLVLGSAQRIGVARLMADTQGQSTRFAVTIEEPGNLSGVVFGGPRVGILIAAADGYWEQDLPAQVQPGRYTVSVYPREAWPWPFDVQLVLQPGRDGCEPNDDEEEACDLRLDTPQPLMLSSFSDIDWFELTLDRPARVALVLGGVPLPDFDAWGAQVRGVAPTSWCPGPRNRSSMSRPTARGVCSVTSSRRRRAATASGFRRIGSTPIR